MSILDLVRYYSARANEYEDVYLKPERQDDLRRLHDLIPEFFADRQVLDVACGTGYWTRRIAARAKSIVGCDLSDAVLRLAKERQPQATPAHFVVGDAFALERIGGQFDAAFVGFWWSHLLREDVRRFLLGLHRRLPAGSPVMIVDNRYVSGSNWPVTRADVHGNTYQSRRLRNGVEYEVLKNFPTSTELLDAIASTGGRAPRVDELTYYWHATYHAG
jgi:SAM-dependent methyltransferase